MTPLLLIIIGGLIMFILGMNNSLRLFRPYSGGDRDSRDEGSGIFWGLVFLIGMAIVLKLLVWPDLKPIDFFDRLQLEAGVEGSSSVNDQPEPTQAQQNSANSSGEDLVFTPAKSRASDGLADWETEGKSISDATSSFVPDAPPPATPALTEAAAHRVIYLLQVNAIDGSKSDKADKEVKRLSQQHPATKVLADDGLYHYGYGPFNSEAAAHAAKKKHGLKDCFVKALYYY